MSHDLLSIGDLVPDPQNARKHTQRNLSVIEDALREVGAARSIVIDENNVVLAGNATIEAAGYAGIENVRVVEASGHEIIAVRRVGLSERQKTRLALFDNRAAELATWDGDVLATLAEYGDGMLDGLFTEAELSDEVLRGGVEDIEGGLEAGGSGEGDGPATVAFTFQPDVAATVREAVAAHGRAYWAERIAEMMAEAMS